jgi:hypothetical protein
MQEAPLPPAASSGAAAAAAAAGARHLRDKRRRGRRRRALATAGSTASLARSLARRGFAGSNPFRRRSLGSRGCGVLHSWFALDLERFRAPGCPQRRMMTFFSRARLPCGSRPSLWAPERTAASSFHGRWSATKFRMTSVSENESFSKPKVRTKYFSG